MNLLSASLFVTEGRGPQVTTRLLSVSYLIFPQITARDVCTTKYPSYDRSPLHVIEKTGRKKIVLARLWTETCVALPTVQAIHDG